MAEKIVGAFKLVVGHEGRPGSVVSTFEGHSDQEGNVKGTMVITQSVTPPGGHIEIKHVTGHIRQMGILPHNETVVSLSGTYPMSGPPNQPYEITEKMEEVATFKTLPDGTATLIYGVLDDGHQRRIELKDLPAVLTML